MGRGMIGPPANRILYLIMLRTAMRPRARLREDRDNRRLRMRVVITGGAGFLGSRLARSILERGQLTDASGARRDVKTLVLIDVVQPSVTDPRVESHTGDLADPALIERALTPETDSVFHLAAVVSGQAEAESDTGMHVNVDATRALLERCRKLARPPKFVFTSSLAVFGGVLPDPVRGDSPITPETAYGAQKSSRALW